MSVSTLRVGVSKGFLRVHGDMCGCTAIYKETEGCKGALCKAPSSGFQKDWTG